MKVAISTTPLSSGSKTRGIGVYTRELIDSLRSTFPNDVFRPSTTNPFKQNVDLVHYPYFDLFYNTLPLIQKLPTVITIHDLIPLKFKEFFPVGIKGKLGWFLQSLAARRAQAIITDSESSKTDIVKFLHIPESRVHVIPLAPVSSRANSRLSSKLRQTYHLPKDFFLYVGDINGNKNISGFIAALAQMENQNAHLVCVGKVFSDKPNIPEYHAIINAISANNLASRVHLLGYVPSHHLPVIYRLARAYVQPSWDEGFGLTILEAMKFGTPVITSNRGSLPEVGGDSAVYFDPSNLGDFAQALDRVWGDQKLRDELKEKGLERVKLFSWKKTATLTRQVYEKIKR